MQHVIIYQFSFKVNQVRLLLVIGSQSTVSEGRDVEELLDHGIHIADTAEVLNSTETVATSALTPRSKSCLLGLFYFMEQRVPKLVDDVSKLLRTLLDDGDQQVVCCLSAIVGLALVQVLLLYFMQIDSFGNVILVRTHPESEEQSLNDFSNQDAVLLLSQLLGRAVDDEKVDDIYHSCQVIVFHELSLLL
jgi:hypothetical protein